MTGKHYVWLILLILLVTTGNIVGPVSLVLSYTKIRGRWIVPVTGLVAFTCGAVLMAKSTQPATSLIMLVAWFPLVTGGLAFILWCYRRSRLLAAQK
jgi:uncharacterized membrane protein HdeD (DUF308 family)